MKAFFDTSHAATNDASPYSFSSIKPRAIYRAGLMQKKGSKFAKASLDGIAILEDDDGDAYYLPVEVKSRVSIATMTEAAERIEDYVGAEDYSPNERYYVETSSKDALLRLLIHDKNNKKGSTTSHSSYCMVRTLLEPMKVCCLSARKMH